MYDCFAAVDGVWHIHLLVRGGLLPMLSVVNDQARAHATPRRCGMFDRCKVWRKRIDMPSKHRANRGCFVRRSKSPRCEHEERSFSGCRYRLDIDCHDCTQNCSQKSPYDHMPGHEKTMRAVLFRG